MPSGSLGGPLTQVTQIEAEMGVGNVAYDENGILYMKVQVRISGGIDNGWTCVLGTSQPRTERGFIITGVASTGNLGDSGILGWNLTGTNAVNDDFFWMSVGPLIINALSVPGALKGEHLFQSANLGKVTPIGTGSSGPLGKAIGNESGGLINIIRIF